MSQLPIMITGLSKIERNIANLIFFQSDSTVTHVKREVKWVGVTAALENERWNPQDHTGVVDDRVGAIIGPELSVDPVANITTPMTCSRNQQQIMTDRKRLAYVLVRAMSGCQTLSTGKRNTDRPSYRSGFHINLLSSHCYILQFIIYNLVS